MRHSRTEVSRALRFFWLVLLASLPFWAAGALISTAGAPIALPASATMFVVPGGVALFLAAREGGALRLLLNAVDVRRAGAAWTAVALIFMPAAGALSYFAGSLAGADVPPLVFSAVAAAAMFALFFAAAVFEEIGWQGHAFPALRAGGMSALEAAVWLGLVWGLWHVIPYMQLHHDAWWIFWQCAFSLAARVVIAWIFVNAGESVFAASLCHATTNVAAFLTPGAYDPFPMALITGAGALAIALVCGPTLRLRA